VAGRLGRIAVAGICLGWALAARAGVRPLVSVMGTCSALTPNTYPADAQAWFDATKQSQVVFYAHLLFPLRPLPAEREGQAQAWHPPLLTGTSAAADSADAFYAQADWRDPSGSPVALFGLSLTARLRSDYLSVNGREYIPHTFAMAIGTRDLRSQAGQLRLPSQEGTYSVRFSVDGRDLGLSFFRMVKPAQSAPAAGSPQALSPAAAGLQK
jgi:hypothetical protein